MDYFVQGWMHLEPSHCLAYRFTASICHLLILFSNPFKRLLCSGSSAMCQKWNIYLTFCAMLRWQGHHAVGGEWCSRVPCAWAEFESQWCCLLVVWHQGSYSSSLSFHFLIHKKGNDAPHISGLRVAPNDSMVGTGQILSTHVPMFKS